MKKIFLYCSIGFLISNSNILAQTFRDQGLKVAVDYTEKPSNMSFTWLEPKTDQARYLSSEITVKAGINSNYKIIDASFILNGARLNQERGLIIVREQDPSYDTIMSRSVHLSEGRNNLIISATDEKGKTFTKDIYITYVNEVKIQRNFALLFATDHYDEWPDLSNPVFDATTIAEELKDNYNFGVEVVENPTYDKILTKLREYANKSFMDNDQLFIFFAGHGQFDESFKEGYLVCKDTKFNDPGRATYINHSTIKTYVNNLPAKHIFLVIDACFGGTINSMVAKAGFRGNESGYQMSNEEFIARKLKYKTRKYLTSGGKEYVPDGIPGHHSPFTRKLLEALRSYGGSKGLLTSENIYAQMQNLNPEPLMGEFGDNEPGSSFIFIPK